MSWIFYMRVNTTRDYPVSVETCNWIPRGGK